MNYRRDKAKRLKRDCHTIKLPDGYLIDLQVRGIFSYFKTSKPTEEQLFSATEENLVYLTPDSEDWDPDNPSFAKEEENFIGPDGTMFNPDDSVFSVSNMEDNDDDKTLISLENFPSMGYDVSSVRVIDKRFELSDPVVFNNEDLKTDIDIQVCTVNATLDSQAFVAALQNSMERSKFAASIGMIESKINSSDDLLDQMFCNKATALGEVAKVNAKARSMKPSKLARLWRIKIEDAKRTLQVTSQLKRHDCDSNIAREFTTNDHMIRYKRIRHYFFTDTFFVTKKCRSWSRGNKCMQIFVSGMGFIFVVGMRSKSEFPKALKKFAKEVGVPLELICDASGEQTSKEVKTFCQQIGITLKVLEANTQKCNLAELYIGLLKRSVRKDMLESRSPLVLWDYCCERRAMINNYTARNLFQLEGTNPYSKTFGDVADISSLCRFSWYQWCWFYNKTCKLSLPKGAAWLLSRSFG